MNPYPEYIPPEVTELIPSVNSGFNVSNIIEIAANATDNTAISQVFANITLSNGTIKVIELTNGSGHNNKFNLSYNIPALIGTYNITFIANDTENNINNSETTNFTVYDVVNPSVFNLTPTENASYNISDVIEIATITSLIEKNS